MTWARPLTWTLLSVGKLPPMYQPPFPSVAATLTWPLSTLGKPGWGAPVWPSRAPAPAVVGAEQQLEAVEQPEGGLRHRRDVEQREQGRRPLRAPFDGLGRRLALKAADGLEEEVQQVEPGRGGVRPFPVPHVGTAVTFG